LRAVEPDERVANLAVHVVDGTGHALATEALVAVAQLDRLVLAGRGPRRDHGAALGARHEMDLHLHRRVAAGVEDLAAHDVLNARHVLLLLLLLLWVTLPPTPGGRVGVRVRPLARRRRAPGARDLVNGLSGRLPVGRDGVSVPGRGTGRAGARRRCGARSRGPRRGLGPRRPTRGGGSRSTSGRGPRPRALSDGRRPDR